MRPPALKKGDRIAIVAPASAPRDEARLNAGIAHLRKRGYRPERLRYDYAPEGYLSGSDADRLGELNAALRDPKYAAIFCVRGGYGTLRLLDDLDYDAARAHPKLLVGYSDITALQMALLKHAGWASLSGPMVAADWHDPDPAAERLFFALAEGDAPQPLRGPDGEDLIPVRPGTAEGLLLGGNLAMITRLVGTPHLPDLDGAILFVEEINEPPYRIDGMLAQLKLAGVLDALGGLVLGRFTGWEDEAEPPTLTLSEVLLHYIDGLACPVADGLAYGHIPRKNTLPLGVRARLAVEGESAALSVLEPVVD